MAGANAVASLCTGSKYTLPPATTVSLLDRAVTRGLLLLLLRPRTNTHLLLEALQHEMDLLWCCMVTCVLELFGTELQRQQIDGCSKASKPGTQATHTSKSNCKKKCWEGLHLLFQRVNATGQTWLSAINCKSKSESECHVGFLILTAWLVTMAACDCLCVDAFGHGVQA